MIRFVADENFDGKVLKGIRKLVPDIDVVRVQDIGLYGEEDPVILEWAAAQERILLTHDAETMPGYAYERVKAGKRMPGVIEVDRTYPFAIVIDQLAALAMCSLEGEWEGRVIFLPLR